METKIQVYAGINHSDMIKIMEILNENNIPYIMEENNTKQSYNDYAGQSNKFKRIFVDEKDYEKAMQLVEPILQIGQEEVEIVEEVPELSDDDSDEEYSLDERITNQKHNIYWKVIMFSTLGLIAIAIICAIIASFR